MSAEVESKKADFGVIILGNSGVGKSFLVNIIANTNYDSRYSPDAVTINTEFVDFKLGPALVRIYNIPGLLESDQERIDENIKQIEKAFTLCEKSIILFVMTTNGGRIKDEDVVAYNAINQAYPFEKKSLGIILNDLDRTRVNDTFIAACAYKLKRLNIQCDNLLPVYRLHDGEPEAQLKERVMKFIFELEPTTHIQHSPLTVRSSEVRQLIETIKTLQDQVSQLMRENEEAKKDIIAMNKELKLAEEKRKNITLGESSKIFFTKLSSEISNIISDTKDWIENTCSVM